MYDSLHCGISECRPLTSHDSPSKSAQYLRSSREFGVKIWLSGFQVKRACDHGEIHRQGERTAISKIGAAGSGFFGTNTKEE